jgi:hypothetical protein
MIVASAAPTLVVHEVSGWATVGGRSHIGKEHRMIHKLLFFMLGAIALGAVTMTIQSREEIARFREISKM